jgi:putative glycosyltransferase (TIGR04372 family)
LLQVLIRKFKTAAGNPRQSVKKINDIVLIWTIGIPVAIIMRLFYPMIHFRVGTLLTYKMGIFAFHVDNYLTDKWADRNLGKIDLLGLQDSVPVNLALFRLAKNKIKFFPLGRHIDIANKLLPSSERYQIPLRGYDQDRERRLSPAFLELDSKVTRCGEEWLEKVGIKKDARLVLFSNRDSTHLNTLFPELDWREHDFRDSTIGNMIPLAEKLVEKGYYAIRMGAHVAEPVKSNNPHIIDYASLHRTDELDLFLGSKCEMFFGCPSGMRESAELFRRPYGVVNACPFLTEIDFGSFWPWIPKLYWSVEDNRLMTFSEIMDSEAGHSGKTSVFKKLKIKPIENTADEILDFGLEMKEYIDGTHHLTREDKELNSRFWEIISQDKPIEELPQIGAHFLRRHQSLLE